MKAVCDFCLKGGELGKDISRFRIEGTVLNLHESCKSSWDRMQSDTDNTPKKRSLFDRLRGDQ